jgi:hypothetical protein
MVGVMARDALVNALVRPLGVVVQRVLGKDGAQVRLVDDQDLVEQFAA